MTHVVGQGVVDEEPSIHDILRTAKELESDRLSLQCCPSLQNPAGICVIMVGKAAIQDISPLMTLTANEMGQVKPQERLQIKFTDSVNFIFQWLVENGIPWTFSMFEFETQPVMLFAIVGTKECLALCDPLTQLGCPTDLSNEPSPVETP